MRIVSIIVWGLVGAVGGFLAAFAMSYVEYLSHPNEPSAGVGGMLSVFFFLPAGLLCGLVYGATRRI